jgi:peptide chain release factor subunit 1
MSAPQQNEAEKNIEIWKVKKLIKRLEAAYVVRNLFIGH